VVDLGQWLRGDVDKRLGGADGHDDEAELGAEVAEGGADLVENIEEGAARRLVLRHERLHDRGMAHSSMNRPEKMSTVCG